MKRNFHFPLCVQRADDKYDTEATNIRESRKKEKASPWKQQIFLTHSHCVKYSKLVKFEKKRKGFFSVKTYFY